MPHVTTTGLPIGRTLKVERVAAGLSLTDVAKAIGVSVGHMSHIEAGRRTASDDRIRKIRAFIAGAKS